MTTQELEAFAKEAAKSLKYHQEIVMVALSLSWSRKTKLALRRWMIRF